MLGLVVDLPTPGSLLASAVDGHINSLDLIGGRESLELFASAGLVIIQRDEISDRTLGISGNLIDSPDQTGQVFTYLARENRDGGFSAASSYIAETVFTFDELPGDGKNAELRSSLSRLTA